MVDFWVHWVGFAAIFVAWSFALYIYLVAPKTRGAKYLIAILVVDGVISRRQRGILDNMITTMNLDKTVVQQIEMDMIAAATAK